MGLKTPRWLEPDRIYDWLFGRPGPAGRGAGYPAGMLNGGWSAYDWENPSDYAECGFDEPTPANIRLSDTSLAVRRALGERRLERPDALVSTHAFCRALLNPCVHGLPEETQQHDLLIGFQSGPDHRRLLIGSTDYPSTLGITTIDGRRWRNIGRLANPEYETIDPAAAADYARAAFDRWCKEMTCAPAKP